MHEKGCCGSPVFPSFQWIVQPILGNAFFLPGGKFTQENSLSRHLGPSKPRSLVFLAIVLHFDTSPRSLLGGIFPMWGDFFSNTQF
jgi:hypothetical protein